jgi:hypothetical protein
VTANRFHRTKLCAAACALNAARNLNLKLPVVGPIFSTTAKLSTPSAALSLHLATSNLKTIDLQLGRGLLRGTKYEVER